MASRPRSSRGFDRTVAEVIAKFKEETSLGIVSRTMTDRGRTTQNAPNRLGADSIAHCIWCKPPVRPIFDPRILHARADEPKQPESSQEACGRYSGPRTEPTGVSHAVQFP